MYSRLRKYFCSTDSHEYLNVHSIFRPLYVILSLFGLFPYSVKFVITKNQFDIVPKSIFVNVICAVSSMLILHAALIAHIQYIFKSSEKSSMTDALMTQLNYILELSTLTLYCSVAYTCAYLNGNRYVKILNELTLTFAELENENTIKILRRVRLHVNVALTILVVSAFLMIAVNFTRDDSMWKMILVLISFDLPQALQMISLIFFYTLVMMVVAVLACLDEHLRSMKHCLDYTSTDGVIKVYEKKSAVTLRQLELIYTRAVDIKSNINEAFQAAILVSTLQCFHSIVSEAYFIYHGAVSDVRSTHDIVNCSIWIIYQFLKIYSLAHSGNMLKDEAQRVAQSLHVIPTEKYDLRMLLEVQHFSLLINYHGTVLSVYGYFPLDATLMSTIIATATMYLIILVQFEKNNQDCIKSSN